MEKAVLETKETKQKEFLKNIEEVKLEREKQLENERKFICELIWWSR